MMWRSISRIGRDQSGASIIEMALAAPFFAALLIGMSDMARGFSMKLQLEQAAQRAIELVENQKSVSADYATLAAEASTAATESGFSGSTVVADYWLECSGVRQGDGTPGNGFNNSCPNATDTTVRYVRVSISNSFSPMFGSRLWPNANANGTITVTGQAGVRIQ